MAKKKQFLVAIVEYNESGDGLIIHNVEPFTTKKAVADFIKSDYEKTIKDYGIESEPLSLAAKDIANGKEWETPGDDCSNWIKWKVFSKNIPE